MRTLALGIIALTGLASAVRAGWSGDFNLSLNNDWSHLAHTGAHPLAVDRAGNVHVVWQDSTATYHVIRYRRYDAATRTWGVTSDVSIQDGFSPTIAVDSSDNAYVLWGAVTELRLRRRSADGIWGAIENVANPVSRNNFEPSAVIDPAGRIHIIWVCRITLTSYAVYYNVREPGTTPQYQFPGGEQITTVNKVYAQPTLVLDRSRVPHAAFVADQEVWYSSHAGSTWDVPVALTAPDPPGSDSCPALCLDARDGLHLTCVNASAPSQVYHQVAVGGHWSAARPITQATTGVRDGAALAADPWGNLHAVWHDSRDGNFEVYYTKLHRDTWQGTEERLTDEPARSEWPALAHDPSRPGSIHVVWSDYRRPRSDIFYKWYDSFGGDIACPAATSPDTGRVGQDYTPVALVRNRAAEPRTFAVRSRIRAVGSPVEYDQPVVVEDLSPGLDSAVTFPPWVPGELGFYELTVTAEMPGDTNPVNDTARLRINVAESGGLDEERPGPVVAGPVAVHPNPASRTVAFDCTLPASAEVRLVIYDATGVLVRMVQVGSQPAGARRLTWDLRDQGGATVAPGVYFCRLAAGTVQETCKVLVVRSP